MSDRRATREYGAAGWIGIGTPQANPTVEMEMRRLLPAEFEPLTARMTSASESADARLLDYIEGVERTLRTFDVLPLDAFGFACTGSSYLIGAERERTITTEAEAAFGYPVVTAAQAILEALGSLNARRIAILAPYPVHLIEASKSYWQAAGLQVATVRQIDLGSLDTRLIYGLGARDALAALEGFDVLSAEALLMSGTGMPTIGAIEAAGETMSLPVISSNSSLAWALARRLGHEAPPYPPAIAHGMH